MNWFDKNIDDIKDDFDEILLKYKMAILYPLIMALFFILFRFETYEDYYNNKLADEQYSGIITRKYIDTKNRNWETLIYKTEGVSKQLYHNWTDLYDTCKINDRILKHKGEKKLFVIRPNSDTIKLEYNRNKDWTGSIIFRFSH